MPNGIDLVTDVLVIGSGLSGLLYALKLTKKTDAKITLITKRTIDEANTRYAQGGIASVLSPDDSFDLHVKDTLVAGDGLCNKSVVEFIVKHGPKRIKDLEKLGVTFNKDPETGAFALGREGGHSKRRIAHYKDMTGYAVEKTLVKQVKENAKIEILEHHLAINLVFINGKVTGAYVLDINRNEVITISARLTVLATGGAGKVFLYTSNPDIATGDGLAMAYRVGATIANMEFIQFHPTCVYHPYAKSFLISEALRGEGALLKTINGDRFMPRYHKLAELAPRDIVARAIDFEMKKSGDDHVLLDITFKDPEFIKNEFPLIYNKLLEFNIDMTKTPIPVVPAAHYTIGGVLAKVNGKTDVKGLLAIGEVAYTGLHGANRLASNSLLEAAVMAHEAAKYTKQLLEKRLEQYEFPPWQSGNVKDSDEAVIISHNWHELRQTMWNYVGIVRTTKRLLRAKHRIKILQDEIQEYYWNFKITRDLIELRNLVTVAELIVDSALARKESRGAHYTLDYPEKLKIPHNTLVQRRLGVYMSAPVGQKTYYSTQSQNRFI